MFNTQNKSGISTPPCIFLHMFILQASERRLQDSQDRMLDYERRASDHKQLISELTQKVSEIRLHVKELEHDVSPVIAIELIGDNDLA